MEKRVFGKTGMEVSLLGFGGAEIGFESATVDNVARLLNAALDIGVNVIDTAECYSAGTEETSSERLIGEAVAHRRSEFYLFTKVGHASGLDAPDWSPALIEKSIDRSLRRLKTDCVDLIQLHSCGVDLLKAGDVIAALQKARDAGKTRFIGYSGENEAAQYAVACGAFDSLQTSVSIADQRCLTEWLPQARERQMGVIAKRPIANAAWLRPEDDITDYSRPYRTRLEKLAYPFLTEPDSLEIALRFTASVPGVHTLIVGTKNPERGASNARHLAAGTLPESSFEAIRNRWQEVATGDWTGQT
jgi:hypothetical protein